MVLLTAAQQSSLQPIIQSAASLSFLGSVFIIATYLFVESFRKPSNRLVFYMSFANMLGSIFMFLSSWPARTWQNRALCTAQGWLMNTFMLAAIMWSGCLSLQVLLATRKGSNVDQLQQYERWFHLVSWGVPVALSTLLLFIASDVYGDAVLWCWITASYQEYRFWFFYMWLWAIFLFNFGIYLWVGYVLMSTQNKIRKMSGGNSSWVPSKGMRIYLFKTSFFILAFFINWIWGSVNRLQNMFNPSEQVYALFVLHAIFTPLQGFLNFIAYFLVHYLFRQRSEKDSSTNGSTRKSEDTPSSPGYKVNNDSGNSPGPNPSIGEGYQKPYNNAQDYSYPKPPYAYNQSQSSSPASSVLTANNTPPQQQSIFGVSGMISQGSPLGSNVLGASPGRQQTNNSNNGGTYPPALSVNTSLASMYANAANPGMNNNYSSSSGGYSSRTPGSGSNQNGDLGASVQWTNVSAQVPQSARTAPTPGGSSDAGASQQQWSNYQVPSTVKPYISHNVNSQRR
ncbi:hypothetical protein BJ742DRAFT_836836 [Cladochytrium replicatum]|nr:hypothetical protein BJ742DRAFT_836836 [Cladochytrium replicatum]